MSQVRPGGCPRELVEPASISTMTDGMGSLPVLAGLAGVLGCGQDREGPLRVEGKLL
jgi:hypothetical protein